MIVFSFAHVFAPDGHDSHVNVVLSRYVPSWHDEHLLIEFTTVHVLHLYAHSSHSESSSI